MRGASTEDVIQLIEHVSYKKTEGKLYLMGERLGWMTNTSDTFRISEPYQNIRGQRISPINKEKVQLQLLLHSTTSYTFHFVHPEGRDRQIYQRDEVKNILQKLLPRFKDKAYSELSEKKKISEKNPKVVELYKELVTNKYLCKDEFWEKIMKNDELNEDIDIKNQPKGIPTWFLSQNTIKAQSFNLNEEMIEDICSVFPSVKLKYAEILADKKSTIPITDRKVSFWSNFFQSHYFHKMRSKDEKDIFNSCAELDKDTIQHEANRLISDKSEKSNTNLVKDEFDQTKIPCNSTNNLEHSYAEELLHRYNRHYHFLLNSMVNSHRITIDNSNDDGGSQCKKIKLSEMDYNDVYNNDEMKTVEAIEDGTSGVLFNSKNVTNYINKFSNTQTSNKLSNESASVMPYSFDEQKRRLRLMLPDITSNMSPFPLMTSSVATVVLTKVGYLLSGVDPLISHRSKLHSSRDTMSNEYQLSLNRLYSECQELLQHFWDCFPITDNLKFERLHRMREALKRFGDNKLYQWDSQHLHYHVLTGYTDIKATDHLRQMLKRAEEGFQRFISFYNKKNTKTNGKSSSSSLPNKLF